MQEAQRAAKASNKQVPVQKQKETSTTKEEPKKTGVSNVAKTDHVAMTGMLLLLGITVSA